MFWGRGCGDVAPVCLIPDCLVVIIRKAKPTNQPVAYRFVFIVWPIVCVCVGGGGGGGRPEAHAPSMYQRVTRTCHMCVSI